jgi:hypothetical protein
LVLSISPSNSLMSTAFESGFAAQQTEAVIGGAVIRPAAVNLRSSVTRL